MLLDKPVHLVVKAVDLERRLGLGNNLVLSGNSHLVDLEGRPLKALLDPLEEEILRRLLQPLEAPLNQLLELTSHLALLPRKTNPRFLNSVRISIKIDLLKSTIMCHHYCIISIDSFDTIIPSWYKHF